MTTKTEKQSEKRVMIEWTDKEIELFLEGTKLFDKDYK